MNRIATIWSTKGLRNKILFTVGIVLLYRFGIIIRVPGVDPAAVEQLTANSDSGAIGFLSLFTGGAFESFSIFALGVMPYITASIIVQVMTPVIPTLEHWSELGHPGEQRIKRVTRWLTFVLAIGQSFSLVYLLTNGGANMLTTLNVPPVPLLDSMWPDALIAVPALVIGTMILVLFADMIDNHGIGKGMSVLIFVSVLAGMLTGGYSVFVVDEAIWFAALAVLFVALVVGMVTVESAQRRIPVKFPGSRIGNSRGSTQGSYIPVKINQAGVTPVIFATSLMMLPLFAVWLFAVGADSGWRAAVRDHVIAWFSGTSFVYLAVFAAMILAFGFFYNALVFDPVKQARQIASQDGHIPGVRPGVETEKYMARVVNRLTCAGGIYLAAIALLPYLIFRFAGVNAFVFAGVGLLIVVGVALELMRQADADLMSNSYDSFLNDRRRGFRTRLGNVR